MSHTIQTEKEWEQLEAEELARIALLEKNESERRWAKYPRPNPFSHVYGYGSTLYKLKGDADNIRLSPFTRGLAAKAHAKIIRQVNDKQLMSMRGRLIRASLAGDAAEMAKIQQCMRAHAGEDRETGLTEQHD